MDLRKVRELVIIAMFSDDDLMERLVIKGGNALDIVHRMNMRASIDVDFSIEGDFENIDETKARIERSLIDRFESNGYRVFDYKFSLKPQKAKKEIPPMWGGYRAEFKLIELQKYARFSKDFDSLRRNATTIGLNQERVFKIDISKHEYCQTKQEAELDDYTIYVYTLPMIVVEKLRALCQQLPEYQYKSGGSPRARDIFDIYYITNEKAVDITAPEHHALFRHIFAAKEVNLRLLPKVIEQREFHRADWSAVVQAVSTPLKEFDHYYDFLENLIRRLETLWIE